MNVVRAVLIKELKDGLRDRRASAVRFFVSAACTGLYLRSDDARDQTKHGI